MIRRHKWIQYLILAALVAVGGYAVVVGVLHDDSEPIKLGGPAPDFKLTNLDGETVSLEGLKGKPVVVNFWGSFCEPCVREMPLISAMYTEYQSQGLEVLGINLDESEPTIRSFVANYPVTFPVLKDPGGKVRVRYEVMSYPTTYFIDAEGNIAFKYVGEMKEPVIRSYIERILKPAA